MKKYLTLIIICIMISGCGFSKKIQENSIDTHSSGFKDGVECAELAIEMGYPVSYCYEVLERINKQLKEAL